MRRRFDGFLWVGCALVLALGAGCGSDAGSASTGTGTGVDATGAEDGFSAPDAGDDTADDAQNASDTGLGEDGGQDATGGTSEDDASDAAGGETDVVPGDSDAASPPAQVFTCPDGSQVNNGWNTVKLNGVERRYHIDVPAASNTPPAMIFAFHGYSGLNPPTADADQFRGILKDQMGLAPDARPDFPFILVLMEDTNLQPLAGLDWDIRTDSPNVDIPYFEAIVGCLVEHQQADPHQVFAVGFSAGATIANLLHSTFPEVVRAVVSESGLWANEAQNLRIAHQVTFGVELVAWDWPELHPIEPGTAAILLTRGGPSDLVPGSPAPASLDEAGKFARDWLQANGRLVIECPHGGGHILHPQVSGNTMLDFFSAHATPGRSVLMDSDLVGLPASCSLLRP